MTRQWNTATLTAAKRLEDAAATIAFYRYQLASEAGKPRAAAAELVEADGDGDRASAIIARATGGDPLTDLLTDTDSAALGVWL